MLTHVSGQTHTFIIASSQKILSTNGALSEFQTYPTQCERTEVHNHVSTGVIVPRTCMKCVLRGHTVETHTFARETTPL